MNEIAENKDDKPFVDFFLIADDVMLLAEKTMHNPSKDMLSMSKTMYRTWHTRLNPGNEKSIFRTYPFKTEQDDEIADLFDKERSDQYARYRINRPVKMIRIKGEKILDELLNRSNVKQHSSELAIIPHQIPTRPYYEGLKIHEGLIKNVLKDLKEGPSGQFLLLWGMGGLGKTTITAEISRRYIDIAGDIGIIWVQLETPTRNMPNEMQPIQAQIARTLVAQLGLLDLIHAPENVKLSEAVKTGIPSQCLLIVDNLDPKYYRKNELEVGIEGIQFKNVIITSRVCLDLQYMKKINVPPLDTHDGVRFIRADADKRGIGAVLPQSDKELIKMCEVTGGLPFAMQLAIGQATILPWRLVVESPCRWADATL